MILDAAMPNVAIPLFFQTFVCASKRLRYSCYRNISRRGAEQLRCFERGVGNKSLISGSLINLSRSLCKAWGTICPYDSSSARISRPQYHLAKKIAATTSCTFHLSRYYICDGDTVVNLKTFESTAGEIYSIPKTPGMHKIAELP